MNQQSPPWMSTKLNNKEKPEWVHRDEPDLVSQAVQSPQPIQLSHTYQQPHFTQSPQPTSQSGQKVINHRGIIVNLIFSKIISSLS